MRKSDQTAAANRRAALRVLVLEALARTPVRTPGAREWKCEITPDDVRTGREYERAAIAAAEREAARLRTISTTGDPAACRSPSAGAARCT
jgi:hypothetical protein